MMLSRADWRRANVESIADVMENVLLASGQVSKPVLDEVVAAVNDAVAVKLPIISVLPKLTKQAAEYEQLAANEIVWRISSLKEDHVREGLSALNHWANELERSDLQRIPSAVLSCVSGRLSDVYSEMTIHLLDTVRNLVARLPISQVEEMLTQCDLTLGDWARRLHYSNDLSYRDHSVRFREELPDLRAAMTKLCVNTSRRGLSYPWVNSWLREIQSDHMPEILRAREDHE
jgi:hypothetical protein